MKSTEFKIIMSVVLFTLFIVGIERYQLSKSISEQFLNFKKSKNELLVNTVMPIVALNLSLGLKSANREYLEQIKNQNSDIEFIHLVDADENIVYEYAKEQDKNQRDVSDYNYVKKEIHDDFTYEKLATLELRFSNIEYENMLQVNREITINITVVTIALLLFFILFIKHIFKNLKQLKNSVLEYDPQYNNFPLELSEKKDEVSLIRNAIISMVKKIALYTEMLDHTNTLLEEKVSQRTMELEVSNAELKLLASVDPLTSLYNRRYFTKSSEPIFQLAVRNSEPLCIVMMDIDNFKSINDTYGHGVGDDVIVSIAKIIKRMTRKSDLSWRFGGEEFVILLAQTGLDGAYTIAEKIRTTIDKTFIELKNSNSIHVTVSIGVTTFDKQKDTNIESIINRADRAMYDSKERGKNLTSVRG